MHLRLLQKLLTYFNGTAISKFFSFPWAGIFPVIQILDLNDLEFYITAASSSL